MSTAVKEAAAERKFWSSPDHVEKLLPFLDAFSTLNLAQAQAQANPKKHPMITEILIGTSNWAKFIKRTCPDLANLGIWNIGEKKAEMRPIIEVLKLLGKPQAHLLKLLHLLLDKLPTVTFLYNKITVTCPGHEAHSMSWLGFCLLEEVEAAMGSSEQKIESIGGVGGWLSIEEPWLSALNSRLLRQEGVIKIKTKILKFSCSNLNHAVAVHNLVRSSERFLTDFSSLVISGPIGWAGWAELAQASQLPQFSGFRQIILRGGRDLVLEGRREDVRALWDATGEWYVHGLVRPITFDKNPVYPEAGWNRLVQFLDKSEDEEPAPTPAEDLDLEPAEEPTPAEDLDLDPEPAEEPALAEAQEDLNRQSE